MVKHNSTINVKMYGKKIDAAAIMAILESFKNKLIRRVIVL